MTPQRAVALMGGALSSSAATTLRPEPSEPLSAIEIARVALLVFLGRDATLPKREDISAAEHIPPHCSQVSGVSRVVNSTA